ncbi:GmrSD restriction endonuclease domain-containing protein [Corynebacterium amycolatum]|uniref:GmrSD restriction endonuclease domain-containing protein n=1 Tax=Corynebacterium amycolatum TaxID=43765 RepID=UPI003EE034E6
MKIDANDRSVDSILEDGQHCIPWYQRPYAWVDQNIDDYWKDVVLTDDHHFLGSIVIIALDKKQHEVVDGQQRLTTIFLTLNALAKKYKELNFMKEFSGLSNYISYVDLAGDDQYRLYNEQTQKSLVSYIYNPVSDTMKSSITEPGLEIAAFRRISRYIDSALQEAGDEDDDKKEALNKIRDKVLSSTFVYVTVEDRYNAFNIFETLNDRGLSLTSTDLVKNLLFSHIPKSQEKSELSVWESIWDSLAEADKSGATPIKASEFLYYFWNSQGKDKDPDVDVITEKRIRRSVDSYIKTCPNHGAASRDLIGDMARYAKIVQCLSMVAASKGATYPWSSLIQTHYPKQEFREDKFEDPSAYIWGILTMQAKQPLPLLLSAVERYLNKDISNKMFSDLLKNMRDLQVRWSIAQVSSTSKNRALFRKYSCLLSSASSKGDAHKVIQDFIVDAHKASPADGAFKAGLKKLRYADDLVKDKDKIVYLLTTIYKENQAGYDFSEAASVEHIEPQHGHSSKSNKNVWVYKLGNLAFLPSSVNSRLNHQEFVTKAPTIAKYVFDGDSVLQAALSNKVWTNEDSNRRTEDLISKATDIWKRNI